MSVLVTMTPSSRGGGGDLWMGPRTYLARV
jgi:hypothetical protein